ncbi:MAG: c-type cytochrome [Candidatus Methylumidiphilus sp.]
MNSKNLWRLAAVGVCFALGGQAAVAAGNAEEGKKKFYTCAGCHAIDGYSNAVPNYPVPRIGGQHAESVLAALNAYKDGSRKHGSMEGNANSWTEQDLQDIAAYVSKKVLSTEVNALTGNPAAGKEKAAVCGGCHGEDGNSKDPNFPRLAGQYEGYLSQALLAYKKGTRKNAIMGGMAQALSEQEIKDISAYYASQARGLTTIAD